MRKGFLDLRRLRYFQEIVKHGSLSAAARHTNVAQPALSHHVAEIERDLGAPVLVRHPSGVQPTELGARLITHAVDILDRVAQAEDDLLAMARQDQPQETVHLAVIPSLAAALATDLIAGFASTLPMVNLHLIEASSSYCDTLIESGKADITIQLGRSDSVEEGLLIQEALFWITLQESEPGPVPLDEVLRTPLILPAPGNLLRRRLELEAAAKGLKLNVIRDIDGTDPRRQAVLAGLGTTVVGSHSVAGSLQLPLAAHRIVDPMLTRPIVMAMRKGFNPTLAETIRNKLRQILTSAAPALG